MQIAFDLIFHHICIECASTKFSEINKYLLIRANISPDLECRENRSERQKTTTPTQINDSTITIGLWWWWHTFWLQIPPSPSRGWYSYLHTHTDKQYPLLLNVWSQRMTNQRFWLLIISEWLFANGWDGWYDISLAVECFIAQQSNQHFTLFVISIKVKSDGLCLLCLKAV